MTFQIITELEFPEPPKPKKAWQIGGMQAALIGLAWVQRDPDDRETLHDAAAMLVRTIELKDRAVAERWEAEDQLVEARAALQTAEDELASAKSNHKRHLETMQNEFELRLRARRGKKHGAA